MSTASNKRALIVGGTHGIGFATAQLLSDLNFTVVVTGRNQPASLPKNTAFVHTDLSNESSLSAVVEAAAPSLDFLFLNASTALFSPVSSVTPQDFDTQLTINFRSIFFIAQKLAPLINPGGSIVFTTSVANSAGYPGMGVYAATKAAAKSLMQTLAAELVGKGVRVNAVSPGFVKTETMGVHNVGEKERREFEDVGSKATPMGRCGTVEEVAKTVAWVGLEATFMTGQEVVIDGGMSVCNAEM